jgi:hypothetical protein
MRRIVSWLLEKLASQLWEPVIAVGLASALAAVYSVYDLWGSWRSAWVGLSVGIVALAATQIYRREQRAKYGGLPHTKTGTITSDDEEKNLLLGEWCVRNTKATDYVAVWEFFPNGTVTQNAGDRRMAKGTWTIEPTCIRIVWDTCQPDKTERHWDKFNRPLKATVRGDDWLGFDCVIASRLSEA